MGVGSTKFWGINELGNTKFAIEGEEAERTSVGGGGGEGGRVQGRDMELPPSLGLFELLGGCARDSLEKVSVRKMESSSPILGA